MDLEVFPSSHNDLKKLQINMPSDHQLQDHFQHLDGKTYIELMLRNDPPEPSLLILSSPEETFHLVYMYYAEPDKFRTKLLFDAHASKTQEARFELSNGQVDRYPLYGTVNREIALQALVYFYNTGDPIPQSMLPEGLFWSDEGYDELFDA